MGWFSNTVASTKKWIDVFVPLKGFNSKIQALTATEVDEIEIILNKKSSDFSHGKFVILNKEDEEITPNTEQKKLLDLLNNGNNIQGRTKFLYLYKYNQHKYGISFIYFNGGDLMAVPESYTVLDNQLLKILYTEKLPHEIENVKDLIRSVYARSKEIKRDNILSVLDLDFDFISISPKIRAKLIPNKVDLLSATNQALKYAMKRTQLMILTPDNGNNPFSEVARSVASPSTDTQVQEQKEKFQEDFSIENGSVTYLNKPMKAIDTNPDNGKLKAFESLKHGFEMTSLMYGIDPRVVNNQTKYDDMELVLKQYVATIEQEGRELAESLSNYFETEKQAIIKTKERKSNSHL